MKVLVYADPTCLYDKFLPSIAVMRDPLLRFCGRALLAFGKVEIRAVVSDFPQALCLTMENGIFSRFPFPRSLRFEPVNFMNGFLNRYREQIWNFPIGPDESEGVQAFCRRLTELLADLCPRRAELETLRKRFRHLVLCPMPAGNCCGEASKDDQILWLLEVMEGVPRDIGVLVTFHDNVESQLNERTVALLRARYPNLVAFDVGRHSRPSAFYFPFVDAILNCETMTGTQGMLVCPRIVALDRTYSAWMADGVGLASLPDVLARPAPDRSAMIYWYLTHFTVMEGRFADADWYYGFINGLLERYRRDDVTFGLFARTEEFSTVADQVQGSCEKCLADIREGHRRRHAPPAQPVQKDGPMAVRGRWGPDRFRRRGGTA